MSVGTILKNRISIPFKTMCSEFSNRQFSLGLSRFFASVFRGTSIGKKLNKSIHKMILKQLKNEFGYVLEKYKDYEYDCCYDKEAPIWICWLQGIESAPEIVKKCVNSIKKSTSHPVHIITEENLFSYYDFPEYIIEKYKAGIISRAQFSDILRMTLLSEHGGLWIDATIYVPGHLPEDIFNQEFYTCKRKPQENGYVSNYMWTSFLNGCQKGCVVQKANKELFYEYWKKKNYLLDYLLVDYFMMLVYQNIPKAHKLIDELPYNNPCIEELQNRMNLPFDIREYKKLIESSDTSLFKLSWRMNFINTTKDKKETYFSYVINN